MTNAGQSNPPVPQEEIDRKVRADFYYWAGAAVRETPDEDGKRVKRTAFDKITPSFSAYIMARASERQEAVLQAMSEETRIMRRHSDGMRRQTTVMVFLSIVLTILVLVQIGVAIWRK